MNKQIMAVLASLLLCSVAIVAEPDPGVAADVDRIIALSGIERQVESVPALFDQSFAAMRQAKGTNVDVVDKVATIMKQSYQPSAFIDAVRKVATENYDVRRMTEIRQFLESPLALKMTELEVAASSPDFMQKLSTFDPSGVPPGRVDRTNALITATHSTEMMMMTTERTMFGFLTAVNTVAPVSKQLTKEQITAMIDRISAQKPQYAEYIRRSMLLTYADATEDELDQYTAFYASENGQWYNELMMQGMLNGFTGCAENAGKALATLVPEAKL